MDDFAFYQRQAKTADDAYRNGLAALKQRADLSEQGKHEEAQRLEAARAAMVSALQRGARDELAVSHTRAQQTLAKEKSTQEKARRELLGAQVYADILRRHIEQMTPLALEAWAQEPHDDWTKAAIAEFGVLEMRARVERSSGKDAGAAQTLRTLWDLDAPTETAAVREARQMLERVGNVEAFVNDLDLQARRERLGGILGVTADNIPAPEAV